MGSEQPTSQEFTSPDQAISFDEFWQMHGESAGFEKKQLQDIWEDAQKYYSDLPYHNFHHVTETLVIANNLAHECEQNGVVVDRKALTLATLFHDAGFGEDHQELGFDSKEEYSASIFLEKADLYGLTAAEAVTGNNAILATKFGNQPQSIEDTIIVRADLDNVAGDYDGFILKTNQLRAEAKQLGGYKGDAIFAATSIRVLSEYVRNDLSLGDWETQHWSLKATQNIQRLIYEVSKQQGVTAAHYAKDLGSTALNLLLLRHSQDKD